MDTPSKIGFLFILGVFAVVIFAWWQGPYPSDMVTLPFLSEKQVRGNSIFLSMLLLGVLLRLSFKRATKE